MKQELAVEKKSKRKTYRHAEHQELEKKTRLPKNRPRNAEG